ERPEVLKAAAAAGEDRDLRRLVLVAVAADLLQPALEAPERRDDARRGLVALDLARDEDDARQRPAPGEDVADVAPDDAGRAGDDRDRRRTGRQRPLGGRVEHGLLGEVRLERLEPQRQVAEPGRLARLDVELERALRLEEVNPAV